MSPKTNMFNQISRPWWIWLGLGALLVLGFIGAASFNRFPGDLLTTRALQNLFSGKTQWAQWVTASAKAPWSYALLALSVIISWRWGGIRLAVAALGCFLLMHLLDQTLKPSIGRPRPQPEWVHVAGSSAGNSCPSTFALIHAGTLGWIGGILLQPVVRRRIGMTMVAGVVVIFAVGMSARVVLGGHWPSDMVLSYGLGLWVVWGLQNMPWTLPATGNH
jgi:membrane-associated phospholipid phosphatase